jgi:hypothetical protein
MVENAAAQQGYFAFGSPFPAVFVPMPALSLVLFILPKKILCFR